MARRKARRPVNPQLQALRDQVYKRERDATKKASRLKSRQGADIKGTSVDPRVGKARIDKMNTAQLNSQLAKLNDFIDRSNQYVGGVRGIPLRKDLWNKYKGMEQEYNKQVNNLLKPWENKTLPSGETIIDRLKLTVPKNRDSLNVNVLFDPKERLPQGVGSDKSIERLIKYYNNRLQPDYFKRELKAHRRQFEAMAEGANRRDLIKSVRGLSDEEFFGLWQYTPFANTLGLVYENAQNVLRGSKGLPDGMVQSANKQQEELIQWAKNGGSTKAEKPKRRSKRK